MKAQAENLILNAKGKKGTDEQILAIDKIAIIVYDQLSNDVRELFKLIPFSYVSRPDPKFQTYFNDLNNESDINLARFKKFLVNILNSKYIISDEQYSYSTYVNFDIMISRVSYFNIYNVTDPSNVSKMFPDEIKVMLKKESDNLEKMTIPFFKVKLEDNNHTLGMRLWF